MNCPAELDLSRYVDGALEAVATAALERHLAACGTCAGHVRALAAERSTIEAAVAVEEAPSPVPAFVLAPRRRAVGWRSAVGVSATLAAAACGVAVFAETVRALSFPEPFGWLDSLLSAGLLEIAFGSATYIALEGRSMFASTLETVSLAVLWMVAMAACIAALRRRGAPAAVWSVFAIVVLGLPAQGDAFEIRRSEGIVTVAADEVIDDTLIAMGGTIEVHGTVNGDLVAMGRRVVVTGTVTGQVFTAAQDVEIDAQVGGTVVGAAQTVSIANSDIGSNLFAFGQTVTTRNGLIAGNVAMFGQRAVLQSEVGRDAIGMATEVELGGNVNGNFRAHGNSVTLRSDTRIGGDMIAHVPDEQSLSVATGAMVGGETRTEIGADSPGARRDADDGFGGRIVGFVLRFVAAFIAGLVLLALVPALRRLSVDTPGETATAAGIGLVALVSVPVIALLVAITIIGLPLAVIGFMLWLVGIYLAKIVVAYFVGRRLLERAGRDSHFTVPLALGLVLTFIVISLPFIGGILNFLLTITGLGMLVIFMWALLQRRGNGGSQSASAY